MPYRLQHVATEPGDDPVFQLDSSFLPLALIPYALEDFTIQLNGRTLPVGLPLYRVMNGSNAFDILAQNLSTIDLEPYFLASGVFDCTQGFDYSEAGIQPGDEHVGFILYYLTN